MKIKTNELTGTALDWAVAKCEGVARIYMLVEDFPEYQKEGRFCYSTNWSQGGPIIERENIDTTPFAGKVDKMWSAWLPFSNANPARYFYGPTPLIAAMRAYVASKFGEAVEYI